MYEASFMRAHARTHARTHAHTHTHTHRVYRTLLVFFFNVFTSSFLFLSFFNQYRHNRSNTANNTTTRKTINTSYLNNVRRHKSTFNVKAIPWWARQYENLLRATNRLTPSVGQLTVCTPSVGQLTVCTPSVWQLTV